MVAILNPSTAPVQRPFELKPASRLVLLEGGRSQRNMQRRYRRRRVGAVLLLLTILLSLKVAVSAALDLASPPGASGSASAGELFSATPSVLAEAGDSLATVARRVQPQGDTTVLLSQLLALNGSGPLQPGTRVLLPG